MSENTHPVFSKLLADFAGKHGAASKPAVVRRQFAEPGTCQTCDRERGKPGTPFFPPHDASARCESGRHNHCSCDTCF